VIVASDAPQYSSRKAVPNRSSNGSPPKRRRAARGAGENAQVVMRHCTICDWEAQLVERGRDEAPLCPWCYGPTERTSVVGDVIPELRPGQKNPYAASLGRLGGVKGGHARAASLTPKQRREIALKAARARWGRKR
jgi:hypothetical protein